MKKQKVLLLLACASLVMLVGCGKKEDTPSEINPPKTETVPEIVVTLDEDSTNNTSDENLLLEDVPPEEGMVRSRLTNEWVSEEQNNSRPIAIMVPNSKTASYYGLSEASVLYEVNVEGGMTRLMAIIDRWQDLDKIGNIRSCRDYFVYWSFEWDAIYIHYGGPWYIDEVIGRDDTANINCIEYPEGCFRDESLTSTDNAFTSSERIQKAMKHMGYKEEYRPNYADDQHFMFAPFAEPNLLTQYEDAINAKKIDMSLAYPVTNCYFVYNEETGLYDRFQNLSGSVDGPHVDNSTNTQLSFKNILIQNTYYEIRDEKGYLAFQCIDNTRDGWFFTNGKGIHVNWVKKSDYGATRYYDDEGNEILFNTGKTMICILEDGDSFTADNSIISGK